MAATKPTPKRPERPLDVPEDDWSEVARRQDFARGHDGLGSGGTSMTRSIAGSGGASKPINSIMRDKGGFRAFIPVRGQLPQFRRSASGRAGAVTA